ncbi:DUF3631 domain-containing protein [Burkholderia pseudomallei]|uniref:DUF3631 domain-containing protein n=1 Tax=Burkholderia pseudomallei TaxID=28450 RepID=UPI000F068F4A|nr:DUF3631 domain-containing protein [Burkholderia pseudomallei]MBF3487577.1 DUF3631 domain-containing protein [Burkholderia pseudomallei]CAJ4818561.1 Protein of uncharacterised function (DUF3631) [Burkholderia pseudomallei]CAJ7340586.1 Protein of uncharacterised function (DUF3631) [Burkholderia pseudomallei]CAJ7905336.1 Protein of uncharacterised function (DUF3631) [Burkholderia pseudomallei]CAJ9365377.1 Protein of uncharacterised function (DUF3631) [Burkholderia pseudomallei]
MNTNDLDMPGDGADIREWLTSDMNAFSEKANALWQNTSAAEKDHPFRLKYGLGENLIWVYGKQGFVDDEDIQNAIVVPYFKGSTNEIISLRFIVVNEDGDGRDIWLRSDSEHIGAYARFGVRKSDTVLLTPSLSDGVSLFAATRHCVAVPENPESVGIVAATLASAHRAARIVVCCDEVSRAAAEAAARMIGAPLVTPRAGDGTYSYESFADLCRQSGADALSALVDSADVPKSDAGADGAPADIAPWPLESPDINELVADVEQTVRRFSVLTDVQAFVVALWIIVSHVMDLMPFSPILGLFSPTKGCGKTTVLGVLRLLVHRPVVAANLTAAYLYHIIARWMPTMLIDEGDTFVHKNSDLTGIINSGHTRISGYVGKMNSGQPKTHPVFCGKVLAMIGRPPATIYHRSIPINLRRKLADEAVELLYYANEAEFAQLKSKIVRWASDNRSAIEKARPPRLPVPDSRMADNFVPLLSVASLGSDELLSRAIAAGESMAATAGNQLSDGEHLLGDVKFIFDSTGRTWIWSHELLAALCQDDDKQWRHCDGGKPLSSRMLADMLRPFGIESTDIREGKTVKKGYKRSSFEDAFARYVNASSHD